VSSSVTVTGNHVFDNSAGIGGVGIGGAMVTDNLIERNIFYGMRFGQLTSSVFGENVLRDNGDHGIRLEDGSNGNRLERNRVSGTGGDGVFLSEDSGANVLDRNRSDRNRDDGFEIDGPGVTLTRNMAIANADLGFEVTGTPAAAERNKAHANRNRVQCVGVNCR
jgi:parallel beta-helix repeat protein